MTTSQILSLKKGQPDFDLIKNLTAFFVWLHFACILFHGAFYVVIMKGTIIWPGFLLGIRMILFQSSGSLELKRKPGNHWLRPTLYSVDWGRGLNAQALKQIHWWQSQEQKPWGHLSPRPPLFLSPDVLLLSGSMSHSVSSPPFSALK